MFPLGQDDPPLHTIRRKLVNQVINAKRIRSIEPWISELVDELLEPVTEGTVDIMQVLAIPLPQTVIGEMIGVPLQERGEFRHAADSLMSHMGPDAAENAFKYLYKRLGELVVERHAEPRDDLVSALLAAREDGHSLDDLTVVKLCILATVGGNETTSYLIANLLNTMADRPDLWAALRADRSLINAAIEESLRFDSPAPMICRTTTRDVELHGVHIPAGSRVAALHGAANRDPRVFEDPDTFRLDRTGTTHLAFGHGIHFCIGAMLARTEARIAINAMLDRYATIKHGSGVTKRPTYKLIAWFYPFVIRTRILIRFA